MYAVERLGSYITRGVYTVSGPFHPFGGAVDIIVVEQPDGSFKSSPWYVRFGKFQGVLKAREKVVTINVNGSKANFHMFLDQRGEAHFLREREEGEGESDVSYSSDEMDDQSQDSRMINESCSYNGRNSSSVIQFDGSNGKIVAVTNSQQSRISRFVFGQRPEKDEVYLKEDDNVGVVTVSTMETAEIATGLVETFMLDEGNIGGKLVHTSESSRDIDESRLENTDEYEITEDVTTAVTCLNSRNPDTVKACPKKKVDVDEASDEKDAVLSRFVIPEDNGLSRVQSSIYCETSRSLEMPYLANEGSGNSHICIETLHTTAKPLTEDAGNCQAEDLQLEKKQSVWSDMCPQQINPSSPSICGHDRVYLDLPVTETSSYSEMVCSDASAGSCKGESKGASLTSDFSISVDQVHDKDGDRITRNMLPFCPGSVDLVQLVGDSGPIKVARVSASESSEEDQFFFSDIDDSEPVKNQSEPTFPDAADNKRLVQLNGSHKFESLTENSKAISSPISIPRRNTEFGPEGTRMTESLPNMWSDIDDLGTQDLRQPLSHSLESNSTSLHLNCTSSDTRNGFQPPHSNPNEKDTQAHEGSKDGDDNPAVEISLCKHLLYEGMGAEAASQAFDAEKMDINRLASLGPEVVKNNRLVVRIRGHYFPWDAAAPVVLGMVAFGSENIFEPEGMIPVNQVEKSLVGDPSKAIDASSGSWSIWPFRRSRSMKAMPPTLTDTRNSDTGNASTSNLESENGKRHVKDIKMLKATTPTSEELSSLKLKEGSNAVTFTFSTAMLGRQKVDARIYLWKWNTRIVISDVDGTITKSDVLGQFMPLVGIDWSQTGVVHLFSAIKDNGYQFLYLSARSISQAYITRQFLVNLKQDGKALPDGPVVISPDGLFPSLFREVIRRAPHEFKIACLEDIKALFPADSSPFYAGFGNRDTDEISYLKVGIPKGKIFIINPKGEVAVNRIVDARSYTSLHALVHGMFPAMTSSEQVQEDYNSWNFWKLPPPHIDDI